MGTIDDDPATIRPNLHEIHDNDSESCWWKNDRGRGFFFVCCCCCCCCCCWLVLYGTVPYQTVTYRTIASHHILPVADVAANDVAVAVDDNDDPATVCYQLPVLYRIYCIQWVCRYCYWLLDRSDIIVCRRQSNKIIVVPSVVSVANNSSGPSSFPLLPSQTWFVHPPPAIATTVTSTTTTTTWSSIFFFLLFFSWLVGYSFFF